MIEDRIRSVSMKKKVSYRENIIKNFWEELNSDISWPAKQISRINDMLGSTREILCIIANEELPTEIIKKIDQLYHRGVRTYLLTDKFYSSYKDTLVGKVLIRYTSNISGTIFLKDPIISSGKGIFINSNLSNTDNLFLKLDNETVREAYRYFCWNFWKKAEYEIKEIKDIETPIKVGETPFDFLPLLSPKHLYYNNDTRKLLTNILIDEIQKAESDIILSFNGIKGNLEIQELLIEKINNGLAMTVYTELARNNSRFIKRLAELGAQIYGYQLNSNNLIIVDGKSGVLLLDSFDNYNFNYRDVVGLKIDQNSIYAIIDYLENYRKENGWHYHISKKLGDIKGNRIFIEDNIQNYLENNAKKISEFETINLNQVVADSLRDLYEKNIEPEFQEECLIKDVLYKWTIIPKFVCKNAKRDKLYEKWEKEKDKFINHLNYLTKKTEYIDKRKKSLKEKTLGKLTQLFLGKNQKKKEIAKGIEEIKDKVESMDLIKINRWSLLVYQANQLADQIEGDMKEIDEKIAEQLAREKWNHKRDKLFEGIKEFKDTTKAYKDEIESIKQEHKETVDQKETEKTRYINRIEDHDEEIKNLKQKIDDIKCQIEEVDDTKKGNEKKIKSLKKVLGTTKKRLAKTKAEKSELENKKRSLVKDIKTSQQSKKSKVNQIEKKIKKENRKIKGNQEILHTLGDKFNYKRIKGSKGKNSLRKILGLSRNELKNKNINEYTLNYPAEELPGVGTLHYSNDQGRQLAISNWSQLDEGESEAERLDAILVCERSVD